MILPRVIYDDSKEISSSVLAAIQDSLHLVNSGDVLKFSNEIII